MAAYRPADRDRLFDGQARFDGGLNSVSDEIALLPNQARKTVNVRLTDFGAITKRGGTQRTHSVSFGAYDVQNGYTWVKSDGSSQIMVVVNGTLSTATYGTFPITYTLQSSALATTGTPAFAEFRDATSEVVYIADGGALNKWNGTTVSTNLSGTPDTKVCVVHNQRLWGCGAASAPDSIFYSALSNGDTLGVGASGGGQIIVRTFGAETVQTLASLGTSLLIFHKRGISRLTGYGQDDTTVDPVGLTPDVGLIAPQSVTIVDNICYFVSERGLYRCTEAEVAPVSTPEQPDPLLPLLRDMSSAELALVKAVINRATRELWISLPGAGCYQYNTILRAWSGPWVDGWLTGDTTCLFEALDASGLPIILRGDEEGWVVLTDAFNDDDATVAHKDNVSADGTGGTVYTSKVQLRRMYCDDDALAKTLRYGYLTANLNGSQSCSVLWRSDATYGTWALPTSDVSLWGSGTWTSSRVWGGPSSKNFQIQMSGNAYYIDVSIVDSGTAIPTFSRFKLQAFALGRR